MRAAPSQLSNIRAGAGEGAQRTRVALTIAGSDSGGGAGIQADLKAFARCGVHGACAITAVTAQSTTGVEAIHPLPPEIVLAQVRVVLADIGADAVKIGMLANAPLARAVARVLDELPPATALVVDPVMIASSGSRLLAEDAQAVLLEEIVPRATVLTPNVPEARALLAVRGGEIDEGLGERELVRALAALGARAVVLTGGHREVPIDLFYEAGEHREVVEIVGERHPADADHGSGCTHSAVLTAELALGGAPLAAARRARELAGLAIAHGRADVGVGNGPVDVFGAPGVGP